MKGQPEKKKTSSAATIAEEVFLAFGDENS